jgi:hypothetical protein
MKISKYLALIMILVITFSCSSNLSKNLVQDGNLILRNGTFADKSWKEDLIFQRISWYHELTMQFDLMMAHITPQSSFNFWFSKVELDRMTDCYDSRIVMAYSLDTKDIPHSSLYEQFEKSGFSRFELPEFKKNLFQHPDSQINGFRLYHIFGICKKSKDTNPKHLNFPGYLEKVIN